MEINDQRTVPLNQTLGYDENGWRWIRMCHLPTRWWSWWRGSQEEVGRKAHCSSSSFSFSSSALSTMPSNHCKPDEVVVAGHIRSLYWMDTTMSPGSSRIPFLSSFLTADSTSSPSPSSSAAAGSSSNEWSSTRADDRLRRYLWEWHFK